MTKLTRREVLLGGLGVALAGTGLYELVDRLAPAPARAAASIAHLPEQHVLEDLSLVTSDGVQVFEPPRHHELVTATLRVDETPGSLAAARAELEHRLAQLDARYSSTPAGLGVTVAWGLPYFRRYVPGQTKKHLPLDRRATGARRTPVYVLEDARQFPSDASGVILEHNEVAVLLRSDVRAHITDASNLLFAKDNGIFEVTSIRRGFAGGGFHGGTSLPKQMATAAGVPGADLIPDRAELFLGFTSTQKQAGGRERIANLETLGYADLGPTWYFAHGTHMHVSHLFEDLEAWYLNFSHQERVDTAFRPGLRVGESTLTVKQGPAEVESAGEVARDYARHGVIGHSGSIQPASRLQQDAVGPDGVLYVRGTPIPHRADFNTLDNPFSWTANPTRDQFDSTPSAGLHFVVFNPTSDDFARNRLAMDGVMPDGRKLKFGRGSHGQGFNSVLSTTHRQNFLVPPRVHRSFPLSELRT
ncbi:MAG: hypothetical protein JO017_12980 [Actinobacteria bacterium]|nr:hypothetical protein [Actinomycetota bacterium]